MGSEISSSRSRPKTLIITGDGLNCERETARAFELAGADPHLVHISDILRREKRLSDYEILAFIGGFSNGDHLGAGTVQASRFRHALRGDLSRFIECAKPIVGICNGFQTIVKMGILPGQPPEWRRTATITANDSGKFEDRWVHLTVNPHSPCIWTRGLSRLFLPVRHGEGKLFMRDRELLDRLFRQQQVVLRYADPTGTPTMEYPHNPNGSLEAIAGICDSSGLIFGLMPHPEACISPYTYPSWTRSAALGLQLPEEGEGLALFRGAVSYVCGREPGQSGSGGPRSAVSSAGGRAPGRPGSRGTRPPDAGRVEEQRA